MEIPLLIEPDNFDKLIGPFGADDCPTGFGQVLEPDDLRKPVEVLVPLHTPDGYAAEDQLYSNGNSYTVSCLQITNRQF